MTALARSTASFALPATQNTAPVHEYRCLYTHDLRKKAKKWHDGSTRFHTFNKRVMVYDDTKNYIGDLHYRADEEFGEGIELQLDRGVLVEVGERIGETQTDLTGIVHKSHAEATRTPAASGDVRPRPVHRVNNLNSQIRPKSLMELLGPSQSRLGRATVTLTSPFEQRQALSEVQQAERPTKRQKTVSGKENDRPLVQKASLPVPRVPLVRSGDSSPALPRAQIRPNTNTQSFHSHLPPSEKVIDISSDEEIQHRPSSASERGRTQRVASDLCSARQNGTKQDSGIKKTQDKTPNITVGVDLSLQPSAVTTRAPIRPLSAATTSSAGSNSSLRPGMSSLRMRSQEPRRKLMYRALLPSDISAIVHPAKAPQLEQQQITRDNVQLDNAPIQGNEADIGDPGLDFDAFDEPDIPSLTAAEAPRTPQAHKMPERPEPGSELQGLSPLFVSQRASQRSPTPARTFAEDDFDLLNSQDDSASHTLPNNEFDDIDNETPLDCDDNNNIEPESPCFPHPPPRSKPAEQPPEAMQPPPKPPPPTAPSHILPLTTVQQTPPSSKSRSFVRSLSEHDSPLPFDPRTSCHHPTREPVEESPIITRQQMVSPIRPSTRVHGPSPSKSPFQRCRSDTAVIVPTVVHTAPTTAAATSDTANEQGAWTSLEAFLLFDTWPACKEKHRPVFEPLNDRSDDDDDDDDDHDNDMIMADLNLACHDRAEFAPPLGARKAQQPVLIRSARAVWRDG